jgi:hypothetical protein
LLRYFPALVLLYGLLGLTAWIAIAGGSIWFWWLPFFLILTPVAVATIAATLHLANKQANPLALNRRIVCVSTLALFYAVPLFTLLLHGTTSPLCLAAKKKEDRVKLRTV